MFKDNKFNAFISTQIILKQNISTYQHNHIKAEHINIKHINIKQC